MCFTFRYRDIPVMDHDEEGNETGWQLARRGIHMALNNEVEEAQEMLKAEVDGSGCPQAQAGFCFIAFMVSTTMQWLARVLASKTMRDLQAEYSSRLR